MIHRPAQEKSSLRCQCHGRQTSEQMDPSKRSMNMGDRSWIWCSRLLEDLWHRGHPNLPPARFRKTSLTNEFLLLHFYFANACPNALNVCSVLTLMYTFSRTVRPLTPFVRLPLAKELPTYCLEPVNPVATAMRPPREVHPPKWPGHRSSPAEPGDRDRKSVEKLHYRGDVPSSPVTTPP